MMPSSGPLTRSLVRMPGVYAPQHDTWALAELLTEHVRERVASSQGTSVLDLCTGTGALGVAAGLAGAASVDAVDVSRRAVLAARLNARRQAVPMRVWRGDLTAAVAGRRFDVVVSNPPYVPAPTPRPARGAARAWDAGVNGRLLLDRICRAAPGLLSPGGTVLLVHSTCSDAARTFTLLQENGLEVAEAGRVTVPFGPVMTARVEHMRRQGLLAPDADCETLVLVRGRARVPVTTDVEGAAR